MKAGSYVEYIGPELINPKWPEHIINVRLPVKGSVYTVRKLVKHPTGGELCLLIDQFSFGYNTYAKKELIIQIIHFREIIPPVSIEREIRKALKRPLKEVLSLRRLSSFVRHLIHNNPLE